MTRATPLPAREALIEDGERLRESRQPVSAGQVGKAPRIEAEHTVEATGHRRRLLERMARRYRNP